MFRDKKKFLFFSKDNFGEFHKDLLLLQQFEGLKIGVFLHKNVKLLTMAAHV